MNKKVTYKKTPYYEERTITFFVVYVSKRLYSIVWHNAGVYHVDEFDGFLIPADEFFINQYTLSQRDIALWHGFNQFKEDEMLLEMEKVIKFVDEHELRLRADYILIKEKKDD